MAVAPQRGRSGGLRPAGVGLLIACCVLAFVVTERDDADNAGNSLFGTHIPTAHATSLTSLRRRAAAAAGGDESGGDGGDGITVLYGVSGSADGFIAEFEASLRSVLLAAPIPDRGGGGIDSLHVHIMADSEGCGAVRRVLEQAGLDGTIWRARITITVHEVAALVDGWRAAVESATKRPMATSHTVGAYFRLFAHQVLPPTTTHAVYLDADAMVLADMSPLWQNRSADALFQIGGSARERDVPCSGFMLLHLAEMSRMMPLLAASDLSQYRRDLETSADQPLFHAIMRDHPDLVGPLPHGWSINFADGAYKLSRGGALSDYYPDAGMLHHNGGAKSDRSFWARPGAAANTLAGWKVMRYFVELPWVWVIFMAKARTALGATGRPLQVKCQVHPAEADQSACTQATKSIATTPEAVLKECRAYNGRDIEGVKLFDPVAREPTNGGDPGSDAPADPSKQALYCQCQQHLRAVGPGAITDVDYGTAQVTRGWSVYPSTCGSSCRCDPKESGLS